MCKETHISVTYRDYTLRRSKQFVFTQRYYTSYYYASHLLHDR